MIKKARSTGFFCMDNIIEWILATFFRKEKTNSFIMF